MSSPGGREGVEDGSLPSRERGLKYLWAQGDGKIAVAPFTGAWIEIPSCSYPTRAVTVAPFTGAWIEIAPCSPRPGWTPVAPFTGAWIEIRPMSSC